MSYLHHTVLPALGALRVDTVTRADVTRWFHEYGRQTARRGQPGARRPA